MAFPFNLLVWIIPTKNRTNFVPLMGVQKDTLENVSYASRVCHHSRKV